LKKSNAAQGGAAEGPLVLNIDAEIQLLPLGALQRRGALRQLIRRAVAEAVGQMGGVVVDPRITRGGHVVVADLGGVTSGDVGDRCRRWVCHAEGALVRLSGRGHAAAAIEEPGNQAGLLDDRNEQSLRVGQIVGRVREFLTPNAETRLDENVVGGRCGVGQ
jgi:hypothetical protein